MKSHEVLRQAFKKVGCKRVAAELKLSLSLIHQWSRGQNGRSEARSPLDVLCQLGQITGDVRPLEWLAEQAGYHLVKNPAPGKARPTLMESSSETRLAMAEMEAAMAVSEADGRVTPEDSKLLRRSAQVLMLKVETYVVAGERGLFRCGTLFWAFGWWLANGDWPELAVAEV